MTKIDMIRKENIKRTAQGGKLGEKVSKRMLKIKLTGRQRQRPINKIWMLSMSISRVV